MIVFVDAFYGPVVRNSFQWPCCNFGSISSTYELHGGRASGGCSDESLTVILKKDDMLIRMDASYLFLCPAILDHRNL